MVRFIQLTANASRPMEGDGTGAPRGGQQGPVAAVAGSAGANALAPSAAAEAEALLECLGELLPTLEEAFGMTRHVRVLVCWCVDVCVFVCCVCSHVSWWSVLVDVIPRCPT